MATEHEKVAFENDKVAFGEEKVTFERLFLEMTSKAPTKDKARLLFDSFGCEGVFDRRESMQMFGIASSSAGKFLTKLKEFNLIEPVFGQGKGKYKFAVT